MTGDPLGRVPSVEVAPRAGTERLATASAADPDGGPRWTVQVGRAPQGLICLNLGQILDGKLGIRGLDGRFRTTAVDGTDECAVQPSADDLLVYGRPFGLGMLVFTLIGFLVGRYQASSVRRSSGGDALVAALAAVVAVLAYDLGGRMFAGSPVLAGSLPVVALVLAGWTALVAIPARWVMGWVWGSSERVSAWAR